ncbi:hypothetical protein P4H08_19155 [Bacillus cereus]|nr:hypothetical protein [Bacillus cereus]
MSVIYLGKEMYNFVANGVKKYAPELTDAEVSLLVEDWQYANYISFVDKYNDDSVELDTLEIVENDNYDINEFTVLKALRSVQYQIEVESYVNSPDSFKNLGIIIERLLERCKQQLYTVNGIDIKEYYLSIGEIKDNGKVFFKDDKFLNLYSNLVLAKVYEEPLFDWDWLDRIFNKFHNKIVGESLNISYDTPKPPLTKLEILASLEFLQLTVKVFHKKLTATEEYEHLSHQIGYLTRVLISDDTVYENAEWADPTYKSITA